MSDKVTDIVSIDEKDINSGRIMEKTSEYVLTQNTVITVPSNYYALIMTEDGNITKVKTCFKKKLLRYVSSDNVGKRLSALYVSSRALTSMSWGIGSLPIKYEFLDNATLNVGASGTLLPEIVDAVAFYNAFGRSEGTLNLTECAGYITSSFRVCASKILVEMFNEASQPIFETSFLVSEMGRRINERLCGRWLENIPGVVFRTASVTSIRVNEGDKASLLEKYGKKKR